MIAHLSKLSEHKIEAVVEVVQKECWWKDCGVPTREQLPVGTLNPLIVPIPLCVKHLVIASTCRKEKEE